MNFNGWKYYKNPITNENIGIMFSEANTSQSRLLTDPDVAKWLEEGNTPLPADE